MSSLSRTSNHVDNEINNTDNGKSVYVLSLFFLIIYLFIFGRTTENSDHGNERNFALRGRRRKSEIGKQNIKKICTNSGRDYCAEITGKAVKGKTLQINFNCRCRNRCGDTFTTDQRK